MKRTDNPACGYHADCSAYCNGKCMALEDTNFGGKDCPFYQSAEDHIAAREHSISLLNDKGRPDLLQKYYGKKGVSNGRKQV